MRAAAILAIIVAYAPPANAAEYHDYFVGFSSEFAAFIQTGASFQDSVDPRSFSFSGTYGPPALGILRFRGGLGWWPQLPFRLFAGIELPLYEVLNSARARAFGIYLLGDLAVTLPLGVTGDLSLAVLVPTSAYGGLRIGIGIDTEARILATAGIATGLYPMRTRR